METKQKILFVDDDSFLREMYKVKLKEVGFEVAVLEDANGDFVDKVSNINPDFIYLDIIMPGRPGFEALELLKADPRTKDIPVMIESNMSESKYIKKGISLGAVDYLVTAYLTPAEFIKAGVDYLNNPAGYINLYSKYHKMKA